MTRRPPAADVLQDRPLELGRESRLLGVGEERADLNAGGAGRPCRRAPRRSGPAGEPERKPQLTELLEVDRVALTIDRLAPVIQRGGSTGRRVVPARGRPLDHEPVHPPARFPGEHRRERVARHDREERRPPERRRRVEVVPGIQYRAHVPARAQPVHLDAKRRRTSLGKGVEHGGDIPGNAGAHQDDAHTREHRAVQGRELGELDLGEQVDSDRPAVPLPARATLRRNSRASSCVRAPAMPPAGTWGACGTGCPRGGHREGNTAAARGRDIGGRGMPRGARRVSPPGSPS